MCLSLPALFSLLSIACSTGNFSQVLCAFGQSRLGEAELMCKKAMAASARIFGRQHEITLRLATGLAGIKYMYSQLGTIDATPKEVMTAQRRQEEAIELYQTVYDARCKALGSDHDDTVNVGSALQRLKQMQLDPYSPFVRAGTGMNV